MTSRFEEALRLAEEILTDIEEGGDVEKSLRKYYRLNKLVNNDKECQWTNNELLGYQNDDNVPSYRIRVFSQGVAIFGQTGERVFIKNNCSTLKDMAASDIPRSYRYVSSNEYTNILGKNTVPVYPSVHRDILATINNRIYNKTTDILFELKFEKMESDIFDETRSFVNHELNEICPKALQKLAETYDSLINSDSPLKLQQIAFACRTILDDFADAVYPPKEEKVVGFDDKVHPVKDNHHINRIVQYVYENAESDSTKDFMKANFEYLNNFLRNIYEQTNIGTHDEREKEHANRCVIYTYLVLGDVIRLSKSSTK